MMLGATTLLAQILWQAPRLLPLAIVIALVAVVGVFVFYVPQARRLRQPWRWGLPLLRLTVGLALAASLVQPVIVRSESEDERGAIILLVDSSRSMSVVDPRTPAQGVALADALGLLPAGSRTMVAPNLDRELTTLLDRLDEAATARADAEYAKLSGQGVIGAQTRHDALAADVAALAAQLAARGTAMPKPSDLGERLAALVPVDAGAQAGYRPRVVAAQRALGAAQAAADQVLYARPDVKAVCEDIAKLSRAQLAERAMSRAKDGVLASLPASGLYGYRFAETLEPMPGAAPAASRPAAESEGLRSDIAGAVRAAAERMRGRAVQAIVLLTDGRQVGGEGTVASSVTGAGTPVYAVSVGVPAPRDVAIVDVMLPQRQFVGETTTARVRLRGVGMKGKSIEVKLEAAVQGQSKAAGQSQSRAVTFAGPSATVEFPLKLESAAAHGVTVSVAPQDGEVTTANNSVRRWVVATADRVAVAIVGASASWDFQHVRSTLARAPWASVRAEVIDAPGARWSIDAPDVAQQSVVVLFDVTADHLSPRQWEALYQFVVDRGGSIIFVAGRNTTLPQFIDSPMLTDLLPFRAGSRPAWRTWPGEYGLFRFQPAPGADDAASLKLGEDLASNAERWLDLPALFQYLPVTELKPNTTPLLVERESGMAMLTDSRLGLGHVLFLGANETWRWRGAVEGSEHDRFWLQLLRYAVDDPYAVRSGPLRLDADRVALEPGQSLRVRAKVSYPDAPPPGDATLPLVITRDGTQIGEVRLTRDAGAAGRYTGTVDRLTSGSYEMQVRDPLGTESVASLPVQVASDPEPEMRDASADERTLRRLAESTGGAFLTLDEWNTLPQRLRDAHQSTRQVAEQRLWDSPQLFAFILGCLGIEWAMRKRLGLA